MQTSVFNAINLTANADGLLYIIMIVLTYRIYTFASLLIKIRVTSVL